MPICTMPGCQTTAGCICDRTAKRPALSQFTDDEIAREYHARALRKLGDPRVCVSAPTAPPRPFVERRRTYDWHYDSQGYCDNPGRGY